MPSSPRAARRARCVTSRSIPPVTSACAPTAIGAEHRTGRRMTPSRDDVEALSRGELTVIGRIRSASNATFLCEAQRAGHRTHCVYKPIAGEAPLWDFPDGTLAGREVSAYLVSVALGWNIVCRLLLEKKQAGRVMA